MGILITKPMRPVAMCRTLVSSAAIEVCRSGATGALYMAEFLHCGLQFASEVLKHLEAEGIVSEPDCDGYREVLYGTDMKPINKPRAVSPRIGANGTG
jgi:DNA segregation ATPase FtsK/SpoIIIE-like protein